jgi:hypothetical protein
MHESNRRPAVVNAKLPLPDLPTETSLPTMKMMGSHVQAQLMNLAIDGNSPAVRTIGAPSHNRAQRSGLFFVGRYGIATQDQLPGLSIDL